MSETSLLPKKNISLGDTEKYNYNVKVKVNEYVIQSDVNPFIDVTVDRTYVPIRFVSEALGEIVEWEHKTKTVAVHTITGNKIELPLGLRAAWVNGIKQIIDAPAMEVSNRLMVPLRFVSEQMGAIVISKNENGWITVKIAYDQHSGVSSKRKKPDLPGRKDRAVAPFELDPEHNTLAPYLFRNNLRVQDGELVFKIPNFKLGTATYYGIHGKITKLKKNQEYRYKLGENGYIGFFLEYEDGSVESYYVYLSTKHGNLVGDFSDVIEDAIVVKNLDDKHTESTLTAVKNRFRTW